MLKAFKFGRDKWWTEVFEPQHHTSRHSPPNIQYRHSLCHQLTHHIDTSIVLTASSITTTTTTTNDKRQLTGSKCICFSSHGYVFFFFFFLLHYYQFFFFCLDCHHQHISTQLRQRRAPDATTGLETCRTRLKPWWVFLLSFSYIPNHFFYM